MRRSGELIDGHLRLKAAQELGLEEVPVVVCDEWTPAQVKAFRLLVNRSATWADWDQESITNIADAGPFGKNDGIDATIAAVRGSQVESVDEGNRIPR